MAKGFTFGLAKTQRQLNRLEAELKLPPVDHRKVPSASGHGPGSPARA
jgi:hypothetical protein